MFDTEQTNGLWVERGGAGDTTYLLLHGGGCNGDVWNGLRDIINDKDAGQWIIPDILGHGRSPWSDSYSIGEFAAGIAPLVRNSKRLIIVGHSMGGSIGLVMASGWFQVQITGVMTIGTIANWTDEVLAKGHEYMAKPVRIFETREEALERYMLAAGLTGLVDANSPILQAGIVAKNGGYCLAADVNILQSSGLAIGDIAGPALCPIRLTCGEHDPLVSIDELRKSDSNAVKIPNAAHNAHVENPATVWDVVHDFEKSLPFDDL